MTNDHSTTGQDAQPADSVFGQDGIANKIAALLAKAESTNSDHERDALIEKASAMMARYQIDQLVIDKVSGARSIDDVIDSIYLVFDHTAYHIAILEFMSAIGDAFGFKVVWRSDRKAGWWYGWRSDLKLAEPIYASLMIQALRAADSYMKLPAQRALPRRMDKHVAKRSFISGFGTGAGHKIESGRRSAKEEATVEHGEANVLPVLASREDELEEWFQENMFRRLGKSNKRARRGDYGASGAGYDAGKRADVGQSRMSSRKAIG